MAVIHPNAGILRAHVSNFHRRWQQLDHVCPVPLMHHGVAVPMRRVQIRFTAHPKQIPTHPLVLIHAEQRKIPEHVTVDPVFLVALDEERIAPIDCIRRAQISLEVALEMLALVVVVDVEKRHELAINIRRTAVRIRLAFRRHNHRADQAGVGVARRVHMRMIQPDD